MAPHFDGLQACSFGGIAFPVEDVAVSGSQRHHVHEYPHTPGGALEKLGRAPYRIRVVPVFDEGIDRYDNDAMPLYPDRLNALQQFYENEVSANLVIPTLGSIQAFMSAFSRRMSSGLRSGERVEMEFVEDQSSRFLVQDMIRSDTANDLSLKADALTEAATRAGFFDAVADVFNKITEIANDVLAIADTAEFYGNYAAGKLATLSTLIQQADARVTYLQSPENWLVLEALKDLGASAKGLYDTVVGENYRPRYFQVPRLMTIQEVSLAIYGRTDMAIDLLQMNAIEDSMAIPQGTQIRWILVE
jgi:prophage DNA circulation protein